MCFPGEAAAALLRGLPRERSIYAFRSSTSFGLSENAVAEAVSPILLSPGRARQSGRESENAPRSWPAAKPTAWSSG